MQLPSWIMSGSFSERLVVALLHFGWQGCLAGGLAVGGAWLLRRASARVRYAWHLSVLLGMAACLPATFVWLGDAPGERERSADESSAATSLSDAELARNSALAAAMLLRGEAGTGRWNEAADDAGAARDSRENPRDSAATVVSPMHGIPPAASRAPVTTLSRTAPWVAVAYGVGVLLALGRLLLGVRGGRRLRSMARLVTDVELLETVAELAQRLGLKAAPTIAWCERISVPVVVGIVAPMILLPPAVASGLTPGQLQALLLHELSHVRRFDPLVNLLQRLIEAMLFFHPVAWLVSRYVRIERELAADDMVLAAGWSRPCYADALLRVAELAAAVTGRSIANGAVVLSASGRSSSELSRRILRLVDEEPAAKLDVSGIGMLATLIMVAVGGAFAWSQTVTGGVRVSPSRPAATAGEPERADETPREGLPPSPPPVATSPPAGLEFLKPYPHLHGLSLDMTEMHFLEIVIQQKLTTRQSVSGDKVHHHLPLGDGLTLIVMFDRNGKCCGIQRIRGADTPRGPKMLRKPARLLPDQPDVMSLGWDRDDRELVTASARHSVSIRRWSVVDNKLLREVPLGDDRPGRPFQAASLTLSDDRRRVLAVADGFVGIWDTATGKLLVRLPIPKVEENDTVRLVTCTPDLSLVVGSLETNYHRTTLIYDAYSVVWDGASGKLLRTLRHEHQNRILALSVSPDGKRLANSHGGGTRVWDVGTGEQVLDVPNDNAGRKHSNPDATSIYTNHVWSVRYSPDGQQLAIGDILGVKLFDAATGKLLRQLDGPYSYGSGSGGAKLVFSPDGRLLARLGTGDKVNGVRTGYVVPIWSTQSGQKLFELTTAANDAAFSADGKRLAVGNSDDQTASAVWSLTEDGATTDPGQPPATNSPAGAVAARGPHRGPKAAELVDKYRPTWSETKLGLQYGVALTRPRRLYKNGERVEAAVFVRNASDQPLRIDVSPDFQVETPQALDARGKAVEFKKVVLLGTIARYVELLQPGEIFGPLYPDFGLGENPRPGRQNWYPYDESPKAGTYKLTYAMKIAVQGAKDDAPSQSGTWSSRPIEFEIVGDDKPANKEDAQATPKPAAAPVGTPAVGQIPVDDARASTPPIQEPRQEIPELAALQGVWCFDVLQSHGWPQPIGIGTDSDGRLSERRWIVRGNLLSWTSQEGERIYVSIDIDPTKSPKQIDFTFRNGPHRGARCLGIYEPQRGDEAYLWFCLTDPGADAPRPTDVSYSSVGRQSMIGVHRVAPPPRPSATRALERFQGEWSMTLCDSELGSFGATQAEASKWTWRIAGDELQWNRQGQIWKLQLDVDPTKSPKEIDLTYLSGPFQGEKCRGMYEWGGIDRQDLMIALQDPGAKVARPQEIRMTGGGRTSLIFLRPKVPGIGEKELASLQGSWKFNNGLTETWPIPVGRGPDVRGNGGERRWRVQEKEIAWSSPEGDEIRAAFTIDATKYPKQIDVKFLSGPRQGETCRGIFQRDEWNDYRLWICLADPGSDGARPTSFSFQREQKRTMISLDWEKPAKP